MLLLVPLLYLPSLGGGFVYDSVGQVEYSEFIHDPANRAEVATLQVLSRDELDRNRPLILASLMADSALWGREPLGYRLTNVLLHAVNTALLMLVIVAAFRIGGSKGYMATGAAFFGCMIFALHPLVVEVVAEPSNREDSLVLLTILVGVLVVLRGAAHPLRGLWAPNMALAILSFLAVTAKESGAAVPFIFAVTAAIFDRAHWKRSWPGLALGLILVGAFLVASYLLRPLDSVIFSTQPPSLAGDFSTAIAVQGRIWAKQLSQIFWPYGLSAHYTPQAIAGFSLPVALVALTVAVGAAAWFARASRLAALGAAVFVLGLLPASNIAPQFHPMADRYLYVPLAGMGMIAAAMIGMLLKTGRAVWFQVSAAAMATALLMALLAANVQRQMVWQDPGALWADVIQKFPGQPIAYLGLANEHYRRGEYEASLRFAAEGVSASRARWDDLVALRAMAEWKTGRQDEARSTFHLLTGTFTDYRDLGHRRLELRCSPEQRATLKEISASIVPKP